MARWVRAVVAAACCAAIGTAAEPAAAAYVAEVVGTVLTIRGNRTSEALALRLAAGDATILEVDVGDDGSADASFDRALFTEISVLAGGGSDTVRIDNANGAFSDTQATTLDGQGGNDTLLGGNGPETLIGGPGRDLVEGRAGVDVVLLGAGADTFVWQPGDGSDGVEGEAGVDLLDFRGSAGSENVDLSANGQRLLFFRDIGNIVLDVDGVERVAFAALGGADTIVVNDLSATAVQQVEVALEGALGLGTGDAQPDSVVLNGSAVAEAFEVAADGGAVVLQGPTPVELRVAGAEAALDRVAITGVGSDRVTVRGSKADDVVTVTPSPVAGFLRATASGFSAEVDVSGEAVLAVDTGPGDDTFSSTGNIAVLVPLEIYGGQGDDTIAGGNGAEMLFGGSGRDSVDGNQGNDVVFLGGGADRFSWDPGDGSDVVEGEGGADLLTFNGNGAAESIDLSANGGRLRFFRNVGNVVLELGGVEQADFHAAGGADIITVNDLSGTAVKRVNLDLEATPGSGAGDAQVDAIIVNGTARPDRIKVAPDAAGALVVAGLHALVAIDHAEAANDSLTVNGLGSVDKITLDGNAVSLIQVTVNPD